VHGSHGEIKGNVAGGRGTIALDEPLPMERAPTRSRGLGRSPVAPYTSIGMLKASGRFDVAPAAPILSLSRFQP